MRISSKPTKKRFYVIILSTLVFLTSFFYKNSILKYIGDETFGGCCYNLTIAKASYTILSWHLPEIIIPLGEASSSILRISYGKPSEWANHQLARIAFVSGDQNTALDYINKEIEYYPDNMNAYYMKGLILGFMNNDHMAIETFKYYTSKTHTWAGHNDLAWLQFKIGDYQGAFDTIDKVYKDNPNNIWVLNTRAIALYNLKRYKEAQADIDNALRNYKTFTPERWGASYPGNNPKIYDEGYAQMGKSLDDNRGLIYTALNIK